MPFMYRRKPAKIDRSRKRKNSFIYENAIRAIGDISEFSGLRYVHILPVDKEDPPFDKADPKKFLALYCTRLQDLSLYEVEHWLDEMALDAGYYFEKLSSMYVDGKRKFYMRDKEKVGIFISNTLFPISTEAYGPD